MYNRSCINYYGRDKVMGMEDYTTLSTDEYRLFSNYVVQYNSENASKIAYETMFTKDQTFMIKLLNKNKKYLEKILVDML